jgi:hypothetical protein
MTKSKLIQDCDLCGETINENGYRGYYKGFCEKHLHLKKMPPRVQGKRGVKDGPDYAAPIFFSHGLPEEPNHCGRG